MLQRRRSFMFLVVMLVLALVLPTGLALGSPARQNATPTPAAEEEATPTPAAEEEESEEEAGMADEEELEPVLVTATVHADLVQPGRLLMSARGNHWVYDSVPPLNGPNEEVNPLDAMLGALISCGMYIYEAVAIENEIALDAISATATGELDPRGVAGADVNPRLRAFHVTMDVEGPTAEEAAMMAEAFSQRCPIYTTLALSAPIDVINVVEGEAQEAFATTADPIIEDTEAEDVELELAMPSASGRLIEFGRAMISARGNHWIYDSVPPINGPNEEVNPLDALVGTLPACGIMVYEAAARENDIALNAVNATVEADLDPRGVAGANVNPRIRAFRVTMNVSGPTMEEAEFLADEWRTRCPIYTTFERSAPIEITNVDMDAAAAESDSAAAPSSAGLSTAMATSILSNQFGRAIVSARGNHFIVDSAPPLGHPAQEINPVEAMLGSLATCGLFIYESMAQEMAIPLTAAQFTAQGDFDVQGLTGAAEVDPRVQEFRVHIDLEGPSEEEAAMMAEQYKLRCPIYTTLEKAAPIEITTNDEEMGGPVAEGLATGTVSASLSNQSGRAILNVRENFLTVDSVPPLGGPNEELNPMDLLLAAQGTCGTFIMEKAAMDMEIPFHGATGIVEADFDPQGLRDGSVSPALQAMRVHWLVGADNAEDAQILVDQWLQRCPIYNTLVRATDIEVSHEVMGTGSAVLEVDFTYNVSTEDYIAEVSTLAEEYAAVDGLVWKIWKLNEDESRAGAVYLFEDAEARQAYLDSDLAATVAGHPALSDFRVQSYEVVAAESAITHAPLMGMNSEMSDADVGTLLEINFTYNVTPEEFMAEVSPLAEAFAASEGLRWKIWALDEENSAFSGVLYFDDDDAMQTFLDSDLATAIVEHPALSDFSIMPYTVMAEESTVTRAPIR